MPLSDISNHALLRRLGLVLQLSDYEPDRINLFFKLKIYVELFAG
jgi:hypothetical protein